MQEGDLLIEDYPLGRNPFVNQVFVVMEKLNKYEIEGRTYQASQSLRKSGLCRPGTAAAKRTSTRAVAIPS